MTKTPVLPNPDPAWAYFLDVDGTLLSIARTPTAVHVANHLCLRLRDLSDAADGAVALITGRSIADIERLFPGLLLATAGQHGIERSTGGTVTPHLHSATDLEAARHLLRDTVARHPELFFEDKGLSIALHYRRNPRLGAFAHRLMRTLAVDLGPSWDVLPGKRVVEIRPAGRNKGTAIREFMEEAPFHGRVPVFIGDDMTDEDGFVAVNQLGGVSIKVGPGASRARWRLRNVAAVEQWLAGIVTR